MNFRDIWEAKSTGPRTDWVVEGEEADHSAGVQEATDFTGLVGVEMESICPARCQG